MTASAGLAVCLLASLVATACGSPSPSADTTDTTPKTIVKPAPEPGATVREPDPAAVAALERAAYAVIDVDSGRTLAEQRPEQIDTPVWPGSIAKIATLAGALEAGTLTADTRIACTRHVRLADGRDVDCSHPPLDHPLSVVDALTWSCNVFTATVARGLTPSALAGGFVRFGLAPPPATADPVAAALGLAGHKATPRALLALLRRVVVSRGSGDERIDDGAMSVVREGLRGSAREGTSAAFGELDIDALAKTGTALMPNGRPLGLVVAAWPSTAPREAVVLALPGGSGAQAAEVAAVLAQRRIRAASSRSTGSQAAPSASRPDVDRSEAATSPAGSSPVMGTSRTRGAAVSDGDSTHSRPTVLRIGTPTSSGYRVESMPLEDYVAAVVSGETSSATPDAARETLAITARTYALVNRHRHADEGFDLCTLTHCQVVRPATLESRRAAIRTQGQVLLRADPDNAMTAPPAGPPVAASRLRAVRSRAAGSTSATSLAPVFYSASCGGQLEDASVLLPNVPRGSLPWLTARPDPAGVAEPAWQTDIAARDLLAALQAAGLRGDHLRDLTVQRTPSGVISRVSLDGLVPSSISADDFRRTVGHHLGWDQLGSLRFTVTRTASGYRFTGRGHGHGVGLCVFGASAMARRGESAAKILETYFPGLKIFPGLKVAEAPPDTAIAAAVEESRPAPAITPSAIDSAPATAPATAIALTLPAEEEGARGALRALLDRTVRDLGAAMDVPPPAAIAVIVYPTGDSYRRATGQPWWTSAVTVASGTTIVGDTSAPGAGRDIPPSTDVRVTIHLVPLTALRQSHRLASTMRHELAHALAAPYLRARPLWVYEGVAMHFAGEQGEPRRESTPSICPEDRAFRQARDRAASQEAYAAAAACVDRDLARGIPWRDIGADSGAR